MSKVWLEYMVSAWAWFNWLTVVLLAKAFIRKINARFVQIWFLLASGLGLLKWFRFKFNPNPDSTLIKFSCNWQSSQKKNLQLISDRIMFTNGALWQPSAMSGKVITDEIILNLTSKRKQYLILTIIFNVYQTMIYRIRNQWIFHVRLFLLFHCNYCISI